MHPAGALYLVIVHRSTCTGMYRTTEKLHYQKKRKEKTVVNPHVSEAWGQRHAGQTFKEGTARRDGQFLEFAERVILERRSCSVEGKQSA